MNNSLPKKISKYRIDRILGQGAMGTVYLAIDESIERKVAIKTISIDSKSPELNKEYSERFVEEAKALAKCTHPNIVTILEFGHENNMAFMVLEYIDGPDLSQVLSQNKNITLLQAINFLTQLLKALNAAHNSQIIHRDIKPENILIAENRTLKLTDFGIAKTNKKDHLTQVGMTLGTPKYMAPEQLFSNEKIGPYTDIYSLFVLFFEILGKVKQEGKFDFVALPTLPQMAKHNNFDSNIKVPSCMLEFIDKGLKTSVVDRYQSISEVIQELKPVLSIIKKAQAQSSKQSNPTDTLTQNRKSIITNESLELEIDQEKFIQIRDDLSAIIGPISDLIITKSLQKTAIKSNNKTKYNKLISCLSEHIENSEIKDEFLNKWRQY